MNRICNDCGREYRKSKKSICPLCEEKLDQDGVREIAQPKDAREYRPRYNGMRFYEDSGD
jgi:predicted amidophosphoribosyltransferase